jgi:hypothetical protein
MVRGVHERLVFLLRCAAPIAPIAAIAAIAASRLELVAVFGQRIYEVVVQPQRIHRVPHDRVERLSVVYRRNSLLIVLNGSL